MTLLEKINFRKANSQKSMAILIDPDKVGDLASLKTLKSLAKECYVDFFFVGGSLLTHDNFNEVVKELKSD